MKNIEFVAKIAPEQYLLDKNAELEMELDCLRNRESDKAKQLREELAATQLVVKQMREALVAANAHYHFLELGVFGYVELKRMLLKVLALQVSTDALREHDEKVLEEVLLCIRGQTDVGDCEDAVSELIRKTRATKKEN